VKLLLIAEFSPNASGGGPAVVRQMLREWPTDNLFWWSCLPERDVRFEQKVARGFCAGIPRKLIPQQRFTGIKSALLGSFWAPYATAHLARTIRDVQPDAVWVIPHNWSIVPAASAVPKSRAGFHATIQDYVDVHGQTRKFGRARCRKMAAAADCLYSRATTRDATSHPMIADLRERTGAVAAQMLHAGLEREDFEFLTHAESRAGAESIRIAYAGTILVPAEFALFVSALDRLRAQLAVPVSLEFFGSHSYAGEAWFNAAWMCEHGNLPEPQLLAALRECDWGFAPMSLTDDDPRYNRFSFPTKFITYLAAGLPVITLGHPESSVMQMAVQYRVGLATSCASAETLAIELAGALSVPDASHRYREEIFRCAQTEFDATKMRTVLYGCLKACAEATRSRMRG
jgi:hypothetical protein